MNVDSQVTATICPEKLTINACIVWNSSCQTNQSPVPDLPWETSNQCALPAFPVTVDVDSIPHWSLET